MYNNEGTFSYIQLASVLGKYYYFLVSYKVSPYNLYSLTFWFFGAELCLRCVSPKTLNWSFHSSNNYTDYDGIVTHQLFSAPSFKVWITNHITAKLVNLNFHRMEVVSRWHSPQQVSHNYSDLTKWRATILKSCWLMSRWILKCSKAGIYCANKNCRGLQEPFECILSNIAYIVTWSMYRYI